MIPPEVFGGIPLFADLDAEQIRRMAAVSVVRIYEAGECVLREAEPVPPYFHAMITGTMQVFKSAHSGKETTIRLVRAGEIFAWMALMDGGNAPATVRAMTRCRVLGVPHDAMLVLMGTEPALAVRLLATLCERLRDLHEQLHAVVSERARTRLARLIVRHQRRDDATLLPHQVLARMAGITYEESVRIIGEWSHGPTPLLSYGRGGHITVHDPAALATIAEGLDLPAAETKA